MANKKWSAFGTLGAVTDDTQLVGLDTGSNVRFTALTLKDYLGAQLVSPLAYGATGDGVTDDTAALQAMFDDYVGETVVFEGGNRVYAVTDTVDVSSSLVSPALHNLRLTAVDGEWLNEPIIIAASGQNNMRGSPDALGGVFPRNEDVYMWLSTDGVSAPSFVQDPDFATTTYYLPLDDGYLAVGNGANNLGLAFAHRMALAARRPVYLIMDARGSQNITEWVGSGTSSPRYTSLKNNVEDGLAALGKTEISIFIWHQGENNSATANATMQGYLTTLRTQLLAESWYGTTTPHILGNMFPGNATYDAVSDAIRDYVVATASDYVKFASVVNLLEDVGDGIHFSGQGLYTLGFKRYYDALLKTPYTWATPILKVSASDAQLRNVTPACNNLAGGILVDAGRTHLIESDIEGYQHYGVRIEPGTSGDNWFVENTITQVPSSADEYDSVGNFTGIGIWGMTNDCKYMQNTIRWCHTPIILGPGSATALISDCHLYNGNSGDTSVTATISGITKDNPGVFTVNSTTGMAVDRPVWIEGVGGMTEVLYTKYYINTIPSGVTLTLKDATGTPLDTSSFGAYTSGGTLYTSEFEDTKVLQVLDGSAQVTGCYLDNGQIDVYSRSCAMSGNQALLNSNRTVNDYVVGYFAQSNSDSLGSVVMQGMHTVSNRLRLGYVPLIKFFDYTGSWTSGLKNNIPDLLRSDNGATVEINEGTKVVVGGLLAGDSSTPCAIFYSPAGAGFGARVSFCDVATSDYANLPTIRSSGDDLKLEGDNIVLHTTGSGEVTVTDTALLPKSDDSMTLGSAANQWATSYVNNIIQATAATGGAGSGGAGNQYVTLRINGVTYKLLHDGTV